ncbi:hypothetical protein ABZT47_28935 [Sphaerisporangium sp. NPDC005289]|uniref:hypothetical protein n=1 Tax=Sphaerisporangium sp. NPDC005289 TaxID=3155247 RepID=UPI0033A9F945
MKTLNDGGDAKVFYVNTEGWLSSSDLSDSVHPNDTGHVEIADRLAPHHRRQNLTRSLWC